MRHTIKTYFPLLLSAAAAGMPLMVLCSPSVPFAAYDCDSPLHPLALSITLVCIALLGVSLGYRMKAFRSYLSYGLIDLEVKYGCGMTISCNEPPIESTPLLTINYFNMKHIVKWMAGVMAIFAMTGCNQKNTEESANLTPIVVDWNYKDLDYSHWVEDSVLVVPLETKDDCLIGEITYLVYQNHKIYVGDNMSKAVYVFDEKGKLLSTLRKEEYLDISAFTVHDSQLLIYDNMKRKIFFYQEDGDFLYEKDASKVWCVEMFCLGDDLYLYNSSSHSKMGYYHLFKMNPQKGNDEAEASLPFEDNGKAGWGIQKYSCVNGDEALFTTWPFDVVYRLKDGNATPSYSVDFGDRRLPKQHFNKEGIEVLRISSREKYVTGIAGVGQSDRYMFLPFFYSNQTPVVIYDKITDRTMTSNKLYNSNIGGLELLWFGSNPMTYIQNGYILSYRDMVMWVMGEKCGEDWDKRHFTSEYTREQFKKLQQADIEDNPVIIIQKIKEDVELF